MAITKSGTTVSVEYDGSNGYDWNTAYSWASIVAASDAGGWGMTYQNNTYFIPFSVHILPDTYFKLYQGDTPLVLIFTCPTPDDVYWYRSWGGSHSRIGWDGGYNDVWSVYMSADPDIVPAVSRRAAFWGEVDMINTIIQHAYYGYVNGDSDSLLATVKNCYFLNCWFGMYTGNYTALENVVKTGGFYGFQTAGTYSVDNVTIARSNISLLWSGGSGTWRNLKIQDNNSTYETYVRCGVGDRLATFVDCQLTKAGLGFYNSGSGSNLVEQELKTTFSIFVNDEDGNGLNTVSVKLYGQDDTLLLDSATDVNGELLDQETRYYYKWRQVSGGATVDEGSTDYEPLKLVLSKSGYNTLTVHDINVESGVKTTMRQTLVATEPEPLRITGLKVD